MMQHRMQPHSALCSSSQISMLTGCGPPPPAPRREVMYETGSDGLPVVTGLRVGSAGKEKVIQADAYVAALDVPGAQRLVPKPWRSMEVGAAHCCRTC